MVITAKKVNEIFMDCLFKGEEIKDKDMSTIEYIEAKGVCTHVGFNPERLSSRKEDVLLLLNELSSNFRKDVGGGWSFLQLPFDKNERQWGKQKNADELLCLGLGLGVIKYSLPRENWSMLPGGVPYLEIIAQ